MVILIQHLGEQGQTRILIYAFGFSIVLLSLCLSFVVILLCYFLLNDA